MPFGAMVGDLWAACWAHVHWGADFIRKPEIFTDSTFGVTTTNLDFKDNIRPSKATVAKFNTLGRLRRGNHIVLGLFPAMYRMVQAVSDRRGIAGFFAKPKPVVYAGGGGLKGMGVLPDIRERNDAAVKSYLAEVAEVTGADRMRLEELDRSDDPEDKAAFDEICILFFTLRIEELSGVQCLNVYSATEIQPCLFSVGSLGEMWRSAANPSERATPSRRSSCSAQGTSGFR